jgi:hypothetical protein
MRLSDADALETDVDGFGDDDPDFAVHGSQDDPQDSQSQQGSLEQSTTHAYVAIA